MSNHKFYKLAIWHKTLRPMQLQNFPLCAWCGDKGVIKAADVVHHKRPHKGDWHLFTDVDNLQSLCKSCHDGEAQRIERRGYDTTVGSDGWPVDPKHKGNQG